MTFTIVHIAAAFTVGYLLGALGMWLVQRIRKEPEERDSIEESYHYKSTVQFEGLDDEDMECIPDHSDKNSCWEDDQAPFSP